MTTERRFGMALFVLALGNGMLALGNFVADGPIYFIAFEAFAALLLAVVGYTFVYGESELAFDDASDRFVSAVTALIAGVGVVLAAVGFFMAIAL